MHIAVAVLIVLVVVYILHKCCGPGNKYSQKKRLYPELNRVGERYRTPNSILAMYKVRHVNAIVDQFKSLQEVSQAVRKAGLESSNLIFGEQS